MFRERSNKSELLDDLNLSGEELKLNLEEIEKINNTLGGHNVIIDAFSRINGSEKITVLDVGCGSADTLRVLEKIDNRNEYVGLDANENIIEIARKGLSKDSKISLVVGNCFDESIYDKINPDVVIMSLFTHHFKNTDVTKLLNTLKAKTKYIIINDLHRSPLAYYGFKLLMFLLNASRITKHDGEISILRGFKKDEWKNLLSKIDSVNYQIKWKWAFRHQIVINCNQ